MRPATAEEIENWDELVKANPDGGNVLQARAFGEVKGRHGWQDRYFKWNDLAVLVLERHIPGLGRLWYIPKGPGVGEWKELKGLLKALPDLQPFMVKIDPELSKAAASLRELKSCGLVRAPRDIQYNSSTVLVDLQPDEEAILASFKQKTRYNIRLAAKKGVTASAVETTPENIDLFYELAAMTYRRAGVYVRSKAYFKDFWELHAKQGTGQMFFARYEGEVLAAAFITFLGTKALYKDGASSRSHTEVQAPYALQWEAMRWLKTHGVLEYDLHGVPPADQIDNPNHPLAGLARFKTGFNQEVTEYIGTYDLPVDRSAYERWTKIGERLAVAYEYRVKKRLFY